MKQLKIKSVINYRFMSVLLVMAVILIFMVPIYFAKNAKMSTSEYPYADASNCACDLDPWGFYKRQCTSFVAWKLNTVNGVNFHNGMNGSKFGNASNWGNNARNIGLTVDNNPAVGSVAWWSSGHVAWVSSVNGSVVHIEEYNWNKDGNYHTRPISNSNKPTGYIHIADLQTLVIQVGPILYGKSSPNDAWATLTDNYSRDLQVSGSRIAYVSSNGMLVAKEDLHGAWIQEINGFDEYIITPNLLLVRIGSVLYGKERLTDAWTILTTGVTPGFTVSGSRIALRSGNVLMTKDGLHGAWKTQMTGINDFAISSSLIVVRVGSTLYGKINPDDTWATLATGVTSEYKVVGDRIALRFGDTLKVKEGLNGVWVIQYIGLDDYNISDNMLIVRVGSDLYGKATQYDTWSLLATNVPTNVRLSDQWVTFKSGDALMSKQGINGQWLTQFIQFDDYLIGTKY